LANINLGRIIHLAIYLYVLPLVPFAYGSVLPALLINSVTSGSYIYGGEVMHPKRKKHGVIGLGRNTRNSAGLRKPRSGACAPFDNSDMKPPLISDDFVRRNDV